jgi:DNA polymerase-3 subunit alpha
MTEFVHLRLHTEYSLVDGLVRVPALMKQCVADGMPAVAITDACNFYGLIKAYKAAASQGLKLIVGADFRVVDPRDPEKSHVICLLAMDETGYHNLTLLISRGYREGQHHGRPFLAREWISEHRQGLIALSGGREGDIGKQLLGGHTETAEALALEWMAEFPDRFYIELQRTGRPDEETYLHAAVDLAARLNCPVVATNDVRFLTADEFEAHEARVCIGEGRTLNDPRRPRHYSEQQYLRTPDEMAELFSDIPEALANTVEIARRCSVTIRLGEPFLPDFPIPEGMTIEAFLKQVSHEGLQRRLEAIQPADSTPYIERLEFELDIINQMGFPGYFLIVMDFIRWAKEHGIPVGPGRGSGAGSLVAYAL